MRKKIMKIVKGKVFLGVLLFGVVAAAASAVGSTVLRDKDKGEKQLNLGEQPDGDLLAQTEAPTEIEILNVGVEDDLVSAATKQEETTQAEIPAETIPETKAASAESVAVQPELNFTKDSKMNWPISGNIILDYSMDSTIYFPTLDQYKSNPAVLIQADISAPVNAGVAGIVLEVGKNEEIGNYVVLDLGNEFLATYGQLKDISALKGDYITKGEVLGYVSEPTKYFLIEGSNLYFKLTQNGTPIDPINFME